MKIKFIQIREASGETIHSPEAVAQMMMEEAKVDRECLWVFHLNAANRIIEKELVSIGTVSTALVHPREVFKKAISNGASGIVTVHNHPSGSTQPSREDRAIWERLEEAGRILGINVLDHLIITPAGDWYSRTEKENSREREDYHAKESKMY